MQPATVALAPKGRRATSDAPAGGEGGWSGQDEKPAADDWLPVNARRNTKWWYAAFHNVTAMVGAGVLTLPYAMSELGWSVSSSTIYIFHPYGLCQA